MQQFNDPKDAPTSRLVRQLLKIKYVKSVFLAREFISINKSEDGDWDVSHCTVIACVQVIIEM